MNRTFSTGFFLLISAVLLCLLGTSSASEYCQAYYNPLNGFFYNSFYCYRYCCGSCYNRYCCSDSYYRLSQYNCQEKCLSYKDSYNITYPQQTCYSGQVCTGTCDSRLCSSLYQYYLNQNLCTNNVYDSNDISLAAGIIVGIVFASCCVFIIATAIICLCIHNSKKRSQNYTNANIVTYPIQNQNFAYTQPYSPNAPSQQILYPNNLSYPVNGQMPTTMPGQMPTTMPGQMPTYSQQPPYNPYYTPGSDLPPAYSESFKK